MSELTNAAKCWHCGGTGQPGGVMGGPDLGVCSYCLGTGREATASPALVGEADAPHWTDLVEIAPGVQGLRRKSTSATTPTAMPVVEPRGYLFRLRYGPDRWSGQLMYAEALPSNPDDVKEVEPLYTTAPDLRGELERVTRDRDSWRRVSERLEREKQALKAENAALKARVGELARLTPAEIQSGHNRLQWAQGLIEQLPANHDGRNSWLLNHGDGETYDTKRAERGLHMDPETKSARATLLEGPRP